VAQKARLIHILIIPLYSRIAKPEIMIMVEAGRQAGNPFAAASF